MRVGVGLLRVNFKIWPGKEAHELWWTTSKTRPPYSPQKVRDKFADSERKDLKATVQGARNPTKIFLYALDLVPWTLNRFYERKNDGQALPLRL
jgi:hypothetical protein